MPRELSIYAANKLLDHMLRGVDFPNPTVRVALFNGDPYSSGVELSGSGYTRQTTTWAPAAGGAIANSADIVWTNMPAGAITHAALMDASTGGNILYASPLNSPVNLGAGDTYSIPTGQCVADLNSTPS